MASPRIAFLSVGILLFSIQGTLTVAGQASVPLLLSVENDLSNMSPETHFTSVVEGGVLLGALRRIQESRPDFMFTMKEDPNYGLFLESVNGVFGNDRDKTYWEILSENSGEYKRLDVGIGCYVPSENEHIVLRFSTWAK
ncbi:transcobalamin-1-like isoform X2 [Corythoichthys intestinalis]|uniref:transcobalamin-1-like isoform X2 n=1 Tax=Corythoichthys intestinalis TaxID=161448 RepID=UPI0025A64F45|nr:transcobalamin-1-like isoform X2 [Corythoichthys intestinalis]